MSQFTKSRRFRFSLLTLFVALSLGSTLGYWAIRFTMARTALGAFEQTFAGLEAETVTTQQYYEASTRLLNAELRVPFGDRAKARRGHLERIRALKKKVDLLVEVGLFGDFEERDRVKAEVDGYYAEALRLVANPP